MALSEGICSAGGSPSLCAQDMEKAAFLMGGAILSTYRNTYRNRVKQQRAGNAGKRSSLAEGHWRMLCEQDGKTPVLSGLLLRGCTCSLSAFQGQRWVFSSLFSADSCSFLPLSSGTDPGGESCSSSHGSPGPGMRTWGMDVVLPFMTKPGAAANQLPPLEFCCQLQYPSGSGFSSLLISVLLGFFVSDYIFVFCLSPRAALSGVVLHPKCCHSCAQCKDLLVNSLSHSLPEGRGRAQAPSDCLGVKEPALNG